MTLSERYDELEAEIITTLKELIKSSPTRSKSVNTAAIKVKANVFDYVEMTIIHGKLTYIDSRGLQYSIYVEATMEDLIDIINQQK
jgi:hypothetical protein